MCVAHCGNHFGMFCHLLDKSVFPVYTTPQLRLGLQVTCESLGPAKLIDFEI